MYILFEKGTRGRISSISDKYSRTNNKYLKSHNLKQKWKRITYLDANNLYGYAVSKFLPTSRFKWIDPDEFDLNKYISNSSQGCVIEVDIKYPKDIRELQNDYPLALDKQKSEKKCCLFINWKLLAYTIFLFIPYSYWQN